MPRPDAHELLAALRADGGDSADIEAKRAARGWPQDIVPTLSAFANTPGGGTIVFGVDEAGGFEVQGVYDAEACRKALASNCRQAVDPPIDHRSRVEEVEGALVVVAEIPEADAGSKPVRVKQTRIAYLRSHDGDYAISKEEEQAFLASRSSPTYDRQAVPGATPADLDGELVDAYVETCRVSSSSLSRFDDNEILFRTGVLLEGRKVSTAGLLALGIHPQQFLPNLVIQAHATPDSSDPAGTRAIDPRRLDGPIPRMLSDALSWVRRNTRNRVIFGTDGHGRDAPEYPAEAVRELVANALVHRDLGPHAAGLPIGMRLESDQMVITNPGGLYGITRQKLGQQGVSSARNGILIRICQHVRFAGDQRVCEALASGIPTVLAAVRRAQMTPPSFFDQGIHFTVKMPNHALLAAEDLEWLGHLETRGAGLSDVQRHALVMMRRGHLFTNSGFRHSFPMDSSEARRELRGLVERGLVVPDGERGGRTYRIARDLLPDGEREPDILVLEQLRQRGEMTIADLTDATGLSRRQVDHALRKLRSAGAAHLAQGGPGKRTTYAVGPGEPYAEQLFPVP